MARFRSLLCGALALGLAMPAAQGSLSWRPGEGWSDENGSEISASSSRDQLEMAHKLEATGQRDDALKTYKGLLRRWPLSFFAPEAQFRMGKILEDEADFYNAFKAFQTMVQKYPSSDYFEQALGEQYRIANLYLAGEPQRIWKIPVGPSMDKTVEMYQRIIKNAPYGTYAPESQFKIGLAREQQRKYTDAVEAYQKVLDNYPNGSTASNAQYQIGYAWMRASSSSNYDQSAAKKAVDAFQDFLVRYPNSDKAAQAQDNIQRLGQRQTQGAYNIAKFYETQHDSRAAFIYYNEVLREDPNSPQAQDAKKRVQQLRPIVEAMPGGLASDGAPVTVASGLQSPLSPVSGTSSGAPPVPDNNPGTPPADPNTPPPSETPGPLPDPGTAATTPSTSSSTTSTNSAPAPVSASPDTTPLPQ